MRRTAADTPGCGDGSRASGSSWSSSGPPPTPPATAHPSARRCPCRSMSAFAFRHCRGSRDRRAPTTRTVPASGTSSCHRRPSPGSLPPTAAAPPARSPGYRGPPRMGASPPRSGSRGCQCAATDGRSCPGGRAAGTDDGPGSGRAPPRRVASRLRRSDLRASPARACGSSSPAIIASRIARPVTPMTSDTTEPSLTLASSKVFATRLTCLLRSRTSTLRSRVRSRRSRNSGGGTKLPLSSPHSNSWASHSQSLTVRLAPRNVLHVAGVDQQQLEARLQHRVHRAPVHTCGLQGRVRHLLRSEPVPQGNQPGHRRREGARHLPPAAPAATRGDADACHHSLLVHVEDTHTVRSPSLFPASFSRWVHGRGRALVRFRISCPWSRTGFSRAASTLRGPSKRRGSCSHCGLAAPLRKTTSAPASIRLPFPISVQPLAQPPLRQHRLSPAG